MTPAEAEALSRLAQTQLVQIGQGNVFNGADNGGLVIQNTLNGQDIRAHTTLDVSVNTLGLLQALNEIGRAHVCTPVTNAHLVCRLLLEQKNVPKYHNET